MRAFGFALVVFFLSACRTCPPRPPPPPGMLCRGDAECVAPFVCRDPLSDQPGTPLAPGNCTGNCRSDADCRGGRCRGSTCEPSVSTISWPDLLLEMDERPAPFEAAPWINFAGGFRSQPGGTTTASAVGAGIEGTFRLHADTGGCAGSRENTRCPAWLPRLGPWAAVESTFRFVHPHAAGGLAFDLGGPRARSFSTFGARGGLGRGEGATEVVGQVSWGLRFVRMRSQPIGHNGPCRAIIAPVTGLRLYAAARRAIDGGDALTVTLGLEWRPFGRGLGLME